MKAAREEASAGVGHVIAMGYELISAERQMHCLTGILPVVCEALPDLHLRVQKCYALVLTVAEMVGCICH